MMCMLIHGQTDTHTDRQTERQTHIQKDTHTDCCVQDFRRKQLLKVIKSDLLREKKKREPKERNE